MYKKILLVALALLFFNLHSVSAEYVLPYPSFMPGNKLYKISGAVDRLKEFWYWGNIASFKYHLQLADKYLVEAKILFEYKQYLLAVNALHRSDEQFKLIPAYIRGAEKEGKNIAELKKTMVAASKMHISVLSSLMAVLPENFTWTPEKQNSTVLNILELINESIRIRRDIQSE